MTDVNINKHQTLTKTISSDGSTVDLSSPVHVSPNPLDTKAKHELLTADDVRHFVMPHLPMNGAQTAPPYFDSILTDHDGSRKREVADLQYAESDSCATSVADPPSQPKCCCIGVVTASIGSVLATVVVTILFATYLFIVLKGRNAPEPGSTNFSLIGTLLAICAILILFSVAFIYGSLTSRKRWLLPLILLCICFCVASIGTFAAITITAVDDIGEAIQRATNDQTLIIVNIVTFRVAFVVFIILQIVVIVCYIRCYRHISRSSSS
ncbi:hypothetical protein Tcan_17406 [Toxocara canis]|uniref:Uncharacterized protein n=1 Tax=Toxocara canis TaxID=6265 RepID=A0A0B2VUZ6_TOXCA|nr:hypothetical protein Tcan_17406 [Toxocara canis]